MSQKKILPVENEPNVLEVVSVPLEDEGYTGIQANSGLGEIAPYFGGP